MDGTGASIAIDPYLTLQEREELGHIAYFLTQLEALRARGILPDALREAIAAEYRARRDTIERSRRYEALLSAARGLRDKHLPEDALSCALKATQLAPERPEAWMLTIDLHARAHRYDEAIALATNASASFPAAAASRLAELSHEREAYEAARQKAAEQESQAHAFAELSEDLRSAIRQGRDADALELGSRLLQIRPGDLDVICLLALVHTRLGQIDQALALYRELKQKDPANLVWTARISELEARQQPARPRVTEYVRAIRHEDSGTLAPEARPELLTVTWGGIAGEFLKEHWQKLILCLAVLLIVVSSTVGAHHLLGERLLWSRAGQCLLAVVYTSLFAGFGAGLVRWGAERAGRIMLLTTLAVVPVNFSLAGELRLLSLPTPSHLAIFAMVVIVLFPLCWLVVSSLQMKEDGLFPIAFFLLSAFDGTAARGVPFAWGFAALVAASVMFLCAIWGLCARLEKGEAIEERRDFAYFALGLLTYAFLFFAYRSGVFVLRLIPRVPPLMAIPTMFAGMAAVRTARTLPRFDKDPRRILMLRLGGIVLAGLAFALALARSPAPNALLSGNTLATAVLGFCLFATLMWLERQPQYLYLSFGALVVAYFGGYYFLRDLMEQVMLLLGHALGYRGRLPEPFKAINAIVFNLGLVWLWLFFRRRHEERLARHCHYIGLPLSIVACLISSLEPKAAVICMSAYVVLYALGTWFFAQPMLLYLCCAAAAGAVGFAAWLGFGMVPGTWALFLAGIGFAVWITARVLAASKIEEAYRRPLLHSALGIAAIALGLATVAVRPPSAIPIQAVAAFVAVSVLCGLIMLDVPRRSLAYLAVGVAGAGYLLLVAHASEVPFDGISAARLGMAAAAAGLLQVVIGQGATWFGRRRSVRLGRSSRVELYATPLLNFGLFHVALALRACWPQLDEVLRAPDPRSLAALAVALALCSAALAVVAAFAYRVVVFASAVVLLGSAAYAAGMLAGLMELSVAPLPGAMAVAIAALALALALCATRIDRSLSVHSALKLYRNPLLVCALSAVGVTWFLAAPSWSSFALVAVALALACAALVAVVGLEPMVAVAHGAIASALGVWLCIFEIVTHRAVASGPVYGLVVLAFALGLLVLVEVVKGRESRRSRAFSRALPDFAQAAILAALGLVVFAWVNNLAVVSSFVIASLAFLWLT
ncbi:MAG TPA: tetratricopeptide repeat protein, partial [Isosphaeraceae bacterium]|nr:tetratricopeptide repeat protein [Isosphaeraceae bacterium]